MEILFLGKISQKNEDCQFEVKFGTQNNSNMKNSVTAFTLSAFEWKYPFWANLVQKAKIVSLIWNLVASLIQICRNQWCCSLFPF